jgi:hypothetical protein
MVQESGGVVSKFKLDVLGSMLRVQEDEGVVSSKTMQGGAREWRERGTRAQWLRRRGIVEMLREEGIAVMDFVALGTAVFQFLVMSWQVKGGSRYENRG